jgi:hypothetical protein
LQRDEVIAERPDRQRHDGEEHHDGAVHGDQLVVELGKHDATRRIQFTEPASDNRYGLARIGELPPKEHGKREANQEKEQAGQRVLQADDFVIERKNVFSEQNRGPLCGLECESCTRTLHPTRAA